MHTAWCSHREWFRYTIVGLIRIGHLRRRGCSCVVRGGPKHREYALHATDSLIHVCLTIPQSVNILEKPPPYHHVPHGNRMSHVSLCLPKSRLHASRARPTMCAHLGANYPITKMNFFKSSCSKFSGHVYRCGTKRFHSFLLQGFTSHNFHAPLRNMSHRVSWSSGNKNMCKVYTKT